MWLRFLQLLFSVLQTEKIGNSCIAGLELVVIWEIKLQKLVRLSYAGSCFSLEPAGSGRFGEEKMERGFGK